MPIETGTTIAELDDLWPLGGDPILEGDNHLRLIKAVLKAQFPGEAGEGLAAVISATEAEMNYLVGVTSGIQAQIDALISANDDRHPVDSFLFTANAANPSTYGYPGTWILIEGGASINTADSASDAFAGVVNGDNDVDVPLLSHNHSMSHTHSRGTMEITGRFAMDSSGTNQAFRSFQGAMYGSSNGSSSMGVDNTGTGNSNSYYTNFAGSRSWSGNTSQPSSSTTGSKGTSNATINVQGKILTLLCWKRTE